MSLAKILFFITIIWFSIPYLSAKTNRSPLSHLEPTITLEELVIIQQKQYEQASILAQNFLSLIIAYPPKKKVRQKLITHLTTLNTMISAPLKQRSIPGNLNHVRQLDIFLSSLIQNLIHLLDNKCTQVTTLHSNVSNNLSSLTLQYIDASMRHTQHLLERLTVAITNAGLQWYNHLYRLSYHYVIEPIIDNKIHTKSLYGLLIILCIVQTWGKNGEPAPSKEPCNAHGNENILQKSWWKNPNQLFMKLTCDTTPLEMLGWAILGYQTYNNWESICTYLNTTSTRLHHLLHDGIFTYKPPPDLPSTEYPTRSQARLFLHTTISNLTDIATIDVDSLAHNTQGACYKELDNLIACALYQAIIQDQELSQHHLDYAINQEIRHIIMNDAAMPCAEECAIIAAHQAGNTLAIVLLGNLTNIQCVTTRPYAYNDTIRLGKLYTYPVQQNIMEDSFAKTITCSMLLAGFSAEKILLGSCGYDYNRENKAQAFTIALSLTTAGLDLTLMNDAIKTEFHKHALLLLEQYEQKIYKLLLDHKDKLSLLFNALLEHTLLSGQQIQALIGPNHQAHLS